jgi:hypothetical protein
MRGGRKTTTALIGLAVLAGLAAVPVAMRAVQAASWRVAEGDRPFVERALRNGAAEFGVTEGAYRRRFSPRVERRGGETCVALTSVLRDQGGSYAACYDAAGQVVTERLTGHAFGNFSLAERVHEVLLGV